jgi:hypothetical protein
MLQPIHRVSPIDTVVLPVQARIAI